MEVYYKGHTRKQCRTTIQPQPPSGGSTYWICVSGFFSLVEAALLNRLNLTALASLKE